jgi:hypothetical protein
MKRYHVSLILGLAVLACNKSQSDTATQRSSQMASDSSPAGMSGMQGTAGSGMMATMMATMPAHLDSMARMNPEQMSQMMAQHEIMMSQMMDQMGAEMRQMNMAASPEWTALSDSVKADLADLPGLKGQALSVRMRAHARRTDRLLQLHKQMMKM